MASSVDKQPEIDIEDQRKSIRDLVNIVSSAAQLGDETAQRVMDDVQVILTTDWADLSDKLKDDMAKVVARMCCEQIPIVETDDNAEEG